MKGSDTSRRLWEAAMMSMVRVSMATACPLRQSRMKSEISRTASATYSPSIQ
jgi:hypothetical protein